MSKVLVGLSGGVDSAVAAHLLLQQGHEVIAGFMKNYAEPENPHCHTREDRDMALKVAQHLGIKTFIIFDFRQEYHDRIISYIYETYKKGITPNPDVYCNSLIKFDLFLEQALALGCSHVATGHYARTSQEGDQTLLLRGVDHTKDQSYFLSQLNQKQLHHALFPVGEIPKSEVRNIAKNIGLPNADRPDSQGLCFIGDVPIAEFLQKEIAPTPGDVIDATGKKVGTHNGAIYYTLGQRHGFQTPFRAYVTNIDVETNTITVTENREDPLLYTKTFDVTDRHRISNDQETNFLSSQDILNCQIKIRYRQEIPTPATLQKNNDGLITITLSEQQWAVAPGQFAVAYDGETIIGSGIINQRIA